MIQLRHLVLAGSLLVFAWCAARGQGPGAPGWPGSGSAGEEAPAEGPSGVSRQDDNAGQQAPRAATAEDVEKLRKQVELQQKQIELLEKMIRLAAEQIQKDRPSAAALQRLQTQAALLEARTEQAARRDQELASATDELREQADATQRSGPALPATLRELFLPTRTNESPLSIWGTLSAEFQDFDDRPSTFPSPVFSPHFYLLLNEQFLLEVNPEIRANGVSLESAQLDWFLHDNLTLVFGRFYSPLGFFNERLHTTWVFKTPDRPLMFQQVFPAPLSHNGVMARGACYVGDWPVKLEYATFVGNGFTLETANPTARDLADLRAMKEAFDDGNDDKAVGARIGLSFPEMGLIVGLSGLANGAYDRGGQQDLSAWDVDASWHKGNWDVRFEFARTHQQAPGTAIRRRGLYFQVAYRPYDSLHPLLQRLEGVVRYDHVAFDGIDLNRTGLAFGGRERVPVDRNRYTFGLNFYAYASLVFKVAFQINDEQQFREFEDNGFLAQVAWGF